MPAQDGAGWLIRLFPYAPAVLVVVGVLVALYCLRYIAFKAKRQRVGEEKILLLFAIVMLVLPVALLFGISAWFATVSIPAGVCFAVGFTFAAVAFLLQD